MGDGGIWVWEMEGRMWGVEGYGYRRGGDGRMRRGVKGEYKDCSCTVVSEPDPHILIVCEGVVSEPDPHIWIVCEGVVSEPDLHIWIV